MEEDRAQSVFNMAVSYLDRMNAEFYIAIEAAMDLNAFKWYHALLAIFRELSTEMTEEEMTKIDDAATEIQPLVHTWVENFNRYGRSQIAPDLYQKLHKFEMKLRQVLKKSGLQNKMSEDASNALR